MKRAHGANDVDTEFCFKVALVERNESPGRVALVNALKISKKDHNDIVQLATEIQKAGSFVQATACSKLQVIAQQVRFLQQQAKHVLLDAKINTDLHHVACNFVKVPGSTYHLYKRSSGQQYFSMLCPQEWCSPHEFLGSFRLEYDQSWTPTANINEKDNELALINKILDTQQPNLCCALQETPMDLGH